MIILTEAKRNEAMRHARTLQELVDYSVVEEAQLSEAINFLNEIYWSGAQR